jgi:GH24 family phage-related lysozyme (muramidase)
MTKKAHHHHMAAGPSVNEGMHMSAEARARMRNREKAVYHYYDDMGPGKGSCTWGVGILAHAGPCTKEELASPVSEAAVEAEFSRRVAAAEAGVVRNVRNQKLPQDQFDALVSLTFNAGTGGASHTYAMVDRGDYGGAARNIRTLTSTHVNGKKVKARGLVARRAEESAPFDAAASTAATAKK